MSFFLNSTAQDAPPCKATLASPLSTVYFVRILLYIDLLVNLGGNIQIPYLIANIVRSATWSKMLSTRESDHFLNFVKTSVKCDYLSDIEALHDGDMKRISSRKGRNFKNQLFG